MKITSLVENTPGAAGCGAAHGLSLYIETKRHRLLMDTGPSDLLVSNASALGVDLGAVDTVVISHGHYDHSDGLPAFAAINSRARICLRRGAAGDFRSCAGGDGSWRYIGMNPAVADLPGVVWLDGDARIDDELSLFGGVTDRRAWPQGNAKLSRRVGNAYVQDDFSHEQSLVIEENGVRVLLSGCAHNGILNILDRFRALYGGAPDAVISGFHMKKSDEYTAEETQTIRETARELLRWPSTFYTCHCTGLPAYEMMRAMMGDRLRYLHCGDRLVLGDE